MLAFGIALVATAAFASPHLPHAPARPVPPFAIVPDHLNALPAFRRGPLVRLPAGPREGWSRQLEAASRARGPVPAVMHGVVAMNAAALAEARAASRRPRFRMTRFYGDPPPDELAAGFLDVGRLAVVAFRIGGPGGRPDPGRLVDALGLARRAMWARQEAASVADLGAGLAASAYDAERAERARLLALPAPVLAAFLRDLNALDRLQIPLDALLTGHRDHVVLPAGREPGEARLPEGLREPFRPALAWVRDGASRVADARIAKLAARDFWGARWVASQYPAPPAVAYVFHPIDAYARELAAAMPIDAWAHRVLGAEARFDALRIGLAAELYRRAHGGWPITLQALVPAFLPAVPRDPYAPSRPLGWDGWSVFAVGPDGDDDRARRGREPGAWPPPFDRDGDFLLWPDTGFAATR